ncbi:MAG: hypothetical protein AABO41_13155 [Acidobacteriota bacterium]
MISAAVYEASFYRQYMESVNVVLLETDVAEVFQDSESVNQALGVLINIAKNQVPKTINAKVLKRKPHSTHGLLKASD